MVYAGASRWLPHCSYMQCMVPACQLAFECMTPVNMICSMLGSICQARPSPQALTMNRVLANCRPAEPVRKTTLHTSTPAAGMFEPPPPDRFAVATLAGLVLNNLSTLLFMVG